MSHTDQEDRVDDGEAPPPPPAKPRHLKSSGSSSSVSFIVAIAVGLAAVSASAFTYVISSNPTTPTLLDTLGSLHHNYAAAPSIESIADLVDVHTSSDHALTVDQSTRLAAFRDRWNAAQQTPDWSNVTRASISLPRKPHKYYRAEGMTKQENQDAKLEFEEAVSSGGSASDIVVIVVFIH
jgi:hypothetical protein